MAEPARNIIRIEKRILMRDIAYERIKDAILKGIYKPHTRLIEEKVAELIGTSRTPVREVFQKLEKDGLIYKRPKGGYAVADKHEVNIKELTELTIGVTGFAVFLAATKINDNGIKTLEDIIAEEEVSIKHGNLNNFYVSVLKFYRTMFVLGENKILFNTARVHSISQYITGSLSENPKEMMKKRFKLHRQIITCMKKRKPHIAEVFARKDMVLTLNDYF